MNSKQFADSYEAIYSGNAQNNDFSLVAKYMTKRIINDTPDFKLHKQLMYRVGIELVKQSQMEGNK